MNDLPPSDRKDIDAEIIKLGYNPADFDIKPKDNFKNPYDPNPHTSETIIVKRSSKNITKEYHSGGGNNWRTENFLPDLKNGIFGKK